MSIKQRGFTLVEIAIVLVIIGLLLGGILKGQELITSARVRNIADQNSGIQAAYYGFIDRYRQIPGDMTAALAVTAIGSASPTGIGGDGNARLEDDTTAATQYGEASALWAHLSAAQFIQGAYTGGAADDAGYVAGTVSPINAFNGRVMLTRTKNYEPNATASTRLALAIGNKIPVNVMRELDVKIDDGFPQTGVLRHSSVTGTTVFGSTAACANATAWLIDGTEQDCTAIYLY